jgi:hypothetical protein
VTPFICSRLAFIRASKPPFVSSWPLFIVASILSYMASFLSRRAFIW